MKGKSEACCTRSQGRTRFKGEIGFCSIGRLWGGDEKRLIREGSREKWKQRT
jgi:hypothetical protein